MNHKKYVYPELSDKDFGWVRLSGPGLANCLFVAARAYLMSNSLRADFIAPTWEKLSIGPLLRREKDKRHYIGLFRKSGISGLHKLLLILALRFGNKQIIKIAGLGNYFLDLHDNPELARNYILSIINKKSISKVNQAELKNAVAIHIRMGDYAPEDRTPLSWFNSVIACIQKVVPQQQFIIFSDGTDEELVDILQCRNTRRAFYGNALADLVAISSCRLVVASDSTFSAWGAFLGNKPIIFNKRHFPSVYPPATTPEHVIEEDYVLELPSDIMLALTQSLH